MSVQSELGTSVSMTLNEDSDNTVVKALFTAEPSSNPSVYSSVTQAQSDHELEEYNRLTTMYRDYPSALFTPQLLKTYASCEAKLEQSRQVLFCNARECDDFPYGLQAELKRRVSTRRGDPLCVKLANDIHVLLSVLEGDDMQAMKDLISTGRQGRSLSQTPARSIDPSTHQVPKPNTQCDCRKELSLLKDTISSQINFNIFQVDKFHEYVKPVVNPQLTAFCTKLTGITQEKVDKADLFPEVLGRVETWLQDRQLGVEKSYAVLTDGPWDMFRFMYYQCKESDIEMPLWSKKWVNIRKSYCNFYHCGRGGIEIMLKNLGMKFEGSPHSGIDDSINIARIAIKMLSDGCSLNVNEHIQIKYHPHDSGGAVRYEPYKEESVYDSEEEEEQRKKKSEKRRESSEKDPNDTVVNEIENLTLNEAKNGEDEDFDDLLTYYKLQKS
ncbi:uncharacterized protein LOC123546709 [Mercenaria mercenaria]|uniref:uncharacterized protein LOC123546709 n=1 Tax=Mercenaria mercenaria TaxID=6596 RepID=UPI00234EA3C3|nr:uncharacterized protein LOC123546709 [Mercenaria mercenaria]